MLVDNWIFCLMLKCFLSKVGKIFKPGLEQLHIGNSNIQWSDSMKYLDKKFCSGKRLAVDTGSTIRKLHASANSVFSRFTRYVSDLVKQSLIDAYLLPVMTYALES